MTIQDFIPDGEVIVGGAAMAGTVLVFTNRRILAQDWMKPGEWVEFEGIDASLMLFRGGKAPTLAERGVVLDRCGK